MAGPDHGRIARLEAELLDARGAGFECPKCGEGAYEERRLWRGGNQEENSGEWYHYWACAVCGLDVTTVVAPTDG